MEDIFRRKQEIEEKLFEEKKRSEVVKESLSKAETLTNNMIAILNQFDERLHKLEDTILPVHRKTKDLQRLQDNIEKTTVALDHVISYHHVAHDVDYILRQGPNRQVEKYLKCMERLDEAVVFFSDNNPDSPELNSVSTLFKSGKDQLEKEFQAQLSRQTKPFPAKKLAELMKTGGLPQDVYSHLSERSVTDLSQIAQWLSGPGKSQGFAQVYAETRSNNLVITLVGIKDEVRQSSSSTGNRKQGAITSTPRKSGARRASQLSRKASAMLRKESLQNISGLGGIGKSSHPPMIEEDMIETDVESFTSVLAACVQLLAVEHSVMQMIIPERSRRQVFDHLVTASLNILEQDGKKLSMFTQLCIDRHDHPSVINIFPALKSFKQVRPKYGEVLKNVEEQNRRKLPETINQLVSAGVKVLEDFTDCVKSDPEKESNMPKDGIIHELTSNTMLFMQQLVQHEATAGEMLASHHHDSQQSLDKVKLNLAKYISQVLAALKLNLENKSRIYSDDALAAVFLLNNYHFIIDALSRHGLLALVRLSTPEIEEIYNQFINNQKIHYLRCWGKLCGHLSIDGKGTNINPQPGSKLKDKDKQAVKDKFKLFNNEFDELVKTHQQWAMPNANVKQEVRDSVKAKVVPSYTTFRDKYRMVQFTKNIEKYLKYTPEDVNRSLDMLFDQSGA